MNRPAAVSRTTGPYGPPTDDPLAARLFPSLPGSVEWGLERMERVLSPMGSPHLCAPVLHVGGTNGKGSVARIWASILTASGFRVGLYTSPHLVSFRERMLVDGFPRSDTELEELAGELRPALLRFRPSFFEATTALAFLAFARARVDVMVVEVGMGGRLDATNVVRPILTAVTNVSLDHTEMLGPDVASIAREKAGILKAGVPVYTSTEDPAALTVLKEEAAALGSPLSQVRPPSSGSWDLSGLRCLLRTRRWGSLHLEAPLAGHHQLTNLALAVRSLESLPPRLLPTDRAVKDGVAAVRIPGRLQLEEDPPRRWLFDVAHNTEGTKALASTLVSAAPEPPVVAITGILADKPWESMIPLLSSAVSSILLVVPTAVPPARRWDPAMVKKRFPGLPLTVMPGLAEAIERARSLTKSGGTVVVTGSAFTVGEGLRILDRVPREALPPSADFE